MGQIKSRIASFLYKLGLSANMATVTGLALGLFSAIYIYKGRTLWAGVLLLVCGAMDLLDGAIARVSGTAGKFGGIFDSSLDRYGDFLIFAAISLHFSRTGQPLYAVLALSALAGAYEISYVRARAECEINECRVGYWERGERIVFVALGLLLGNLRLVTAVLAVGTHMTAMSRLEKARRICAQADARPDAVNDRSRLAYLVKCAVWAALVIGVRP